MIQTGVESGKSVSKVGFHKRHFPDIHNARSRDAVKPRGRRYIPHGESAEVTFVPHGQHIDPKYTDIGPDWRSSLRPIASPPHGDDYPTSENWPDSYKAVRTFGGSTFQSKDEWMLDPTKSNEKSNSRSVFDGVHKSTSNSSNEVSHLMLYGNGRKESMIDKRNGLKVVSGGDKTYQAVEYSPGFFKLGSTLPTVGYGIPIWLKEEKIETFIPLLGLPATKCVPFTVVESKREKEAEVSSVAALDKWRPATPLVIPPSNIHGKDYNAGDGSKDNRAAGRTTKMQNIDSPVPR